MSNVCTVCLTSVRRVLAVLPVWGTGLYYLGGVELQNWWYQVAVKLSLTFSYGLSNSISRFQDNFNYNNNDIICNTNYPDDMNENF